MVERWRGRAGDLTESVCRNALGMRDGDLRARLEVGWEYVRPAGIRAQGRRYLGRFLELLAEYEGHRSGSELLLPMRERLRC